MKYGATRTVAAPVRWDRFDRCHICLAGVGVPCRSLDPGAGGAVTVRPHPERLPVVDRAEGELILGRPDPRTPYARVFHAAVRGEAVCSGVRIADDTWARLSRLSRRERCQRASCKRIWRAEQWR